MNCLGETDVVILAGGLGTRLRTSLADRPKVMAPINGRPFLAYLIEQVASFGACRIVLSLGHRSEYVREYLDNREWGGLEVVAAVESSPLGTGGGLRNAANMVKSNTLLVMNGDSYTQVDLCEFLSFHRQHCSPLSILLTQQDEVGRFGVVTTGEEDRVEAFQEKPEGEEPLGCINAGIYLMQLETLLDIPSGRVVSLEKDVFPNLLRQGIYGMKGNFPFIDIGTPSSYQFSTAFFAEMVHDN